MNKSSVIILGDSKSMDDYVKYLSRNNPCLPKIQTVVTLINKQYAQTLNLPKFSSMIESKTTEDIVEHALTFGVQSTCNRFNIVLSEVLKNLTEFKESVTINTHCECKIERIKGNACFCWMCTESKDISHSLNERLTKIGYYELIKHETSHPTSACLYSTRKLFHRPI